MPGPLDGVRLVLCGPGRVGTSMALWAQAAGARLVAVGGQRSKPLHPGLGSPSLSFEDLAALEADLLLIAVADSALEATARQLGRTRCGVALHVSGSHTAAVLWPLQGERTSTGSMHPLLPFPGVLETPPEGVVFGIDGDIEARTMAARLASSWRAETVTIPAESRLLYHFGATLAAGGVATALCAAATLAQQLGLEANVFTGYRRLAAAAVQAVDLAAPAAGITGPVARGDDRLVLAQWDELAAVDPALAAASRALARLTLAILQERGPLNDGHRRILAASETVEPAPLS